jgi:hypothetical protein
MKKLYFLIIICCLSNISRAQEPEVVVFKHELRWTDEARFPNYFLLPRIHDSVFYNTRNDLMNYLKVPDIKFPDNIYYNIISGFGKRKAELPKGASGGGPLIGIFSFITRGTSGYAIFWNLKIVIKKNDKILLDREVSHELEYFNTSGYTTSQRWMGPDDFKDIFKRLVQEALGYLPASNEKIIIGSLESLEEKVRSISPRLKRNLLKMNGRWNSGGNFSGLLESENDTLLKIGFREGSVYEIKPSANPLLASLFTDITGIDVYYDQKVDREINGTLVCSGDRTFGIKLKWIATQSKSVKTGDVISDISRPVTAELFDQGQPAGYFLYVYMENIKATDQTTEKFNGFSGMVQKNTLGIERIHRIKGSLSGRPIFAEFNENSGIIMINSEDDLLGVMVVSNCNPGSRSAGGQKLSENKLFITSNSTNLGKKSMEDNEKVEWYPFYLNEETTRDEMEMGIVTLISLFFGMGNMNNPPL